MSIALDGTDQLPQGLPQFRVATSADGQFTDRLKVKFTLARIHGLDLACYTHLENISGDPNLTVEIIQRSLKRAEKLLGRLPPELHIQMDNCFRENKNSCVLNYLGSLCERGLFPKGAHISFLPIGHTHNEMDQVASRISVPVRRKDIHSRLDLHKLLRTCYPYVRIVFLTQIADTKGWLNPGLNVNWTNSKFSRVVNVSKHQF